MNFRKTAAVLLAAALVVTTASCSTKDKSWAAQLGEEKLAAGVYSLNIMTGLNEASVASGVAAEPNVDDIFKADIDGKTGSQYIIDYAKNESMRQLAVDKKFKDLGLALTDEEKASYEDYAKQMYTGDAEMFRAIGVSEQSVIDYNRYSYQAYKLFNTVYGPGGEKAATPEEMTKNFSDTFFTAYIVPFLKVDQMTGAPLEGDALAKVVADADAAYKAIEDGKSIVDIIHETTLTQLPAGTEAPARGVDSDYIMVVDKADTGYFPPLLTQYLPTAEVGKLAMIEDEQFKLIIQKLDETKTDASLTEYYYTQMLPQNKNAEFMDLCLAWGTEFGVVFNEAATTHYTGEKVKKDTDAYLKKISSSSSDPAQVPSSLPETVPPLPEGAPSTESTPASSESASK